MAETNPQGFSPRDLKGRPEGGGGGRGVEGLVGGATPRTKCDVFHRINGLFLGAKRVERDPTE